VRDYLIVTPGYRHNSNGVKCMHYLAHCLNAFGARAELVFCDGCYEVNPLWNSPTVGTTKVETQIVVYPDIISGNPLGVERVVRWYLNRPGYITGVSVFPGPDDLIYQHSAVLGFDYPVLNLMPPGHPAMFTTGKEARQWDCFYVGKSHPWYRLSGLEKDKIEITREWPATPLELAAILRHAHRLYTYDPLSATCLDAVLCGCLVVVVPTPPYGYADLVRSEMGLSGIALSDIDEAIAEAKASLPKARARFLECFMKGKQQVRQFIETTQARWPEL
jgi:O-antigen biosynthesis protein